HPPLPTHFPYTTLFRSHELKIEPLEFRFKNLKDARLREVLERAATDFGWGKSKAAGSHGVGIACGFEKGGYVATCAEVAVDKARSEEHTSELQSLAYLV